MPNVQPSIKLCFRAFLFTAAFYVSASAGSNSTRLPDAPNFRDIGGYSTSNGRTVKSNLVFRSGQLADLTAEDYKILAPLQIRYIFDLRTDGERSMAPTQWQGEQPEILTLSVGQPKNSNPAAGVKQMLAGDPTPEQAQIAMQKATAGLAVNGAAEIGTVLRNLSKGDEPAIIHCTAGKDRTGVTTAFLLTLLGVPRDQVYSDYLRSNDAVPALMAQQQNGKGLTAKVPGMASLKPEVLKTLMGVDRSYLAAAFEAIDKQYGSFEAYTAQGLKLNRTDIEALQAKLLQ